VINFLFNLFTAVLNDLLVVTQFIETMKLLHVQGPENNIKALGDYLRMDGPYEGKDENFDFVLSSRERYGVQLNVKNSFLVKCTSDLEIQK
jgi:hypothetical protein